MDALLQEIEYEVRVKTDLEKAMEANAEDEEEGLFKFVTSVLTSIEALGTRQGRQVLLDQLKKVPGGIKRGWRRLFVHYGPPYYKDYGGDLFQEMTQPKLKVREIQSFLNNGCDPRQGLVFPLVFSCCTTCPFFSLS